MTELVLGKMPGFKQAIAGVLKRNKDVAEDLVIKTWISEIERTWIAVDGADVAYKTSFSDDPGNEEYTKHNGQKISKFHFPFLDGSEIKSEEFDHEALPFYLIEFQDGDRIVGSDEEVIGHDPRMEAILVAVSRGFGICREMLPDGSLGEESHPEGYISPWDLARNGSEAAKAAWVERFASECREPHELRRFRSTHGFDLREPSEQEESRGQGR
jgi:hypothetical protein